MSTGQGNPGGRMRRVRPRRASTYFVLGVVIACAVGGMYLWHKNVVSREIYVANVDLPAYHQIAPSDVRPAYVRSGDVPQHAADDLDALVGRYTLVAAQRGRPISLDRLGPRLPANTLIDHLVVGLPATVADIGGGALALGDRVRILLSSTALQEPRSGTISAIVLDVKPDGGNEPGRFVVVCAFHRADEATLLTAGGTARIFLVRVPPNTPP